MKNVLLEKMILPLADAFSGTSFVKELHHWRNTIGHLSLNQLKDLQEQRLQQLLFHAVKAIPFYKNQSIKLTGNAFQDIKQFPIMHKKLMKENMGLLLVHDKNKMVVEKSSGSSGIQGEVYMTLNENRIYQAVQTFLWEWNNYKLGSSILQTGITPNRGIVKSIKDFLFATQYVNAYNISYDIAVEQLLQAKKNNTQFFGGYASSLNVYAEVALKAGIDIQFEAVLSWGDKLFEHYKTNISKAFGNPFITEHYGTTEGFVISGTCREGNHHLLLPQTYVELLDKDGNDVKDGELGHVVVTRLDAFSFPLIRYYLGDLAIKKPETETCSCGRHFPLLEKIVGRDTDVVHTPNGKALIVHFFTGIMEHFEAVKQFKVIQHQPDFIEIEYIKGDKFTIDELEKIKQVMYNRAQEIFPIHFKEVLFIAATPSGKPQIVENKLIQKPIDK